ncbi:MAG: ribonuclease III [Chloroflexi bacterium]|nr:ribonuclease III [Chloroflexota bacterium]
MSKSHNKISSFQNILGVRFHDPDLLTQALTHRSFVNEFADEDSSIRDNERLEFLGDAVLDIIVADMLFQKYPDVSEGELTQLRAALVRTESLAHFGTQCQLGEFLRLGHGEEITGGRQRITILCRAFEAVIGAMYLDSGMEAVKGFVLPSLLELLDYVIENNLHLDARSELQEQIQARLRITPSYRLADAQGPDHAREFRVEVSIGESIIGSGSGASKRAAAQDAARAALQQLEAVGLPELNEKDDQLE